MNTVIKNLFQHDPHTDVVGTATSYSVDRDENGLVESITIHMRYPNFDRVYPTEETVVPTTYKQRDIEKKFRKHIPDHMYISVGGPEKGRDGSTFAVTISSGGRIANGYIIIADLVLEKDVDYSISVLSRTLLGDLFMELGGER